MNFSLFLSGIISIYHFFDFNAPSFHSPHYQMTVVILELMKTTTMVLKHLDEVVQFHFICLQKLSCLKLCGSSQDRFNVCDLHGNAGSIVLI